MQEALNTSHWASTLHLLLRPILYSAVEVSVPQQLYASLKKWITSESGGKTEHPFLLIPQPPHEGEHSSLCMETGRMNASETTQSAFGLPRSQGSPMYLGCCHEVPSSHVPLTPCHLLSPPVPPPSSGATTEHSTAIAKDKEPQRWAAPATPVPPSPSASCIFPVELRISTMLFIKPSVINQMQNLAALNEQPVSSTPTATSFLPSQPPCFITHHNGGACIHWLLIIAARGAFQMISSHWESRHSSCQTGRKRGISIQVNASFLPVIPLATWLKHCSHSEIKYLTALCFPSSSCPCHPSLQPLLLPSDCFLSPSSHISHPTTFPS